jgi:stage III sporulation protein AD
VVTVAHLVGVALVAGVMLTVLRQYAGGAAVGLLVRLGVALIILLAVMAPLARVLAALNRLVALGHLHGLYLALLLKVLGIAYLATLGAQVAQDMGEGALAGKVELAGKILILVLAVPVVTAIVELIFRLLPS